MSLLVGIGDIGLSGMRDQALEALEGAIAAKDAAELAKAQAQDLVSSDKVFNQPLWDQVRRQAYPTLEPDWHEVVSTVTGSGTSGTYSTANRRITINSGTTSAGTMLNQTIDLASFGYKYGEKVVIRIFLLESTFGAIGESIRCKILRGSSEVDVVPLANVFGPSLLKIDIPYTVQTLLGETINVRVEVASDAPIVPSTRTITWSGLLISNDKERFSALFRRVSQSLRQADIMYATFERNSTVYKGNLYGQVDETDRVTDEINDAIDRNGVYRIPKNANILIAGSVTLSGSVEIIGGGPSSNFIARFNNAIFLAETDQRIILRDFGFTRVDGNYFPTLIYFSPDYLNKNSLIEGLRITNIPYPAIIDNVDGLTVRKTEFLGGQAGIQSGFTSPLNTKNVTYEQCFFDSINLTAIEHRGVGSTDINKNHFVRASTIAECRRSIHLSLLAGQSTIININHNKSYAFREHMIRVALSGTSNEASATVERLNIIDNYGYDGTDSLLSSPLYVSSQYSDKLRNAIIEKNDLYNKVKGIWVSSAMYLRMLNNTVTRHPGTRDPDNSQAYDISQVSQLMTDGNASFGQLKPNVLLNCFMNGSAVTTIKEF